MIFSASTPLHILRGHNDKVMCVDWRTEQVGAIGVQYMVVDYISCEGFHYLLNFVSFCERFPLR